MSTRATTPITDVVPNDSLVEAAGWGVFGAGAEAVVRPQAVAEVAAVLRWAGAAGARVVPVGTGRHLPARAPDVPYILLSAAALDAVEIYEAADVTLTAGAGMGIGALLAATGENDQWLPFDPPDVGGRTLGGLVAAGESGPLAAGYGELRNHVLGATVVCGDGRILRLGGRVVKNVAGFDLLRPVVGSRGELGVVTSVTVRLFPLPAVDRLLVVEGESVEALVPPARAMATAPVLPASIVLGRVDGASRLLVRLHGARDTVDADHGTLLTHAGVRADALEGDEARALAERFRDAGSETESVSLYGRPSQLADLIGRAVASEADTIVADAYRCSVRASGEGAAGLVPLDAASRPSPAVDELAAGLRRVFDPDGVLWSARR